MDNEGVALRFALVSTFFGPHRFGGDAAYVERLAAALLQRGHHVEVFCSQDAFEVVRGGRGPLPYQPPPGLVVHALRTGVPLWTVLRLHQTGGLGPYRSTLGRMLVQGGFDVAHFHNISLMGGSGLLALDIPGTVRLMTVHEHWLACPLSVRWRFGREPCPEPACVRCSLQAGRPPQWWRMNGGLPAAFQSLDAAIFPSTSALAAHRDRGIAHPRARVLPYFVPSDWMRDEPVHDRHEAFLFVGRLVKEKGLQGILPLFRDRPQARLDVVGDGPFRATLQRQAGAAANIRFHGAIGADAVRKRMAGARALLVPSLFPETLGYVVLEAWSQGVPVLVSTAGALPTLVAGGGGQVCGSAAEFGAWIDRWLVHPQEAVAIGVTGRRRCDEEFGEDRHVHALLDLIHDAGHSAAAATRVRRESLSR